MEEQCCKNCINGFEVEPNSHNDYKDHYCGRLGIYINGGDSCYCCEIKEVAYAEGN